MLTFLSLTTWATTFRTTTGGRTVEEATPVVTDQTETATVGETTDATGTDTGTGTETGVAANTSTAKTPKSRSEGFPTKTRACEFNSVINAGCPYFVLILCCEYL